ncbi:carboxypeptidase regulatory-like domain-containing protein [Paludisphaera soli]|uniref:carboxypeptidase regulatory-like domain-containing protein n=1 Tax=Paludisphaera soli TaxID=2712865 RepID=UPI0013EE0001|nr:carboxypeptidase regulatory-like domain-containing protein [Paludisphaera soli]
MRIPPGMLGLLLLGSGLAGCSQTGGFRAVTPSDVKTTATVGDRSVSVVAGLPGEDRVASNAPPSPRSSTGRLSGRVYDEEGNPVRNAVVRLALDGAAGGKAVHATTDNSGAFTLRGVRPGSSYTVIAEYQGEQGMMTGRADADAPDTDVRISLHRRDAGMGDDSRAIAAAPKRADVKPISRADEREADDSDLDPKIAAPRASRSRSVRPRLDTAPEEDFEEPVRGWSSEGTTRPRPSDPVQDEEPAYPPDDLDDGENPLPPAREISQVSARDDEEMGGGSAPRSLPDGLIEGGRTRSRYGPVILDEADPFAEPEPASEPAAEERPSRRPAPTTLERSRPTWSDVVSQNDAIPIDESLAKAKATVATEATPALAAAKPKLAPAVSRSAGPALLAARSPAAAKPAAPAPEERTGPYCEFDPVENRMVDFALYDMDGKLVSIRDFDADLILLDFWGTWCVECRTSIEHLKELQARLGGKKLQVVSLAYEKTDGPERNAKLKEVAEALKINYPVLVRGFQEECPIFEAFQLQFFPTLILLDREGNVLRREQGATEATLARIDRAIAENLEGGKGYARRQPIGRTTR